MLAFHLPSGEQGCWPLHGTFALLTTAKVFTALPTLIGVMVLTEYLAMILAIVTSEFGREGNRAGTEGIICAIYNLSPATSYRSVG